MHNGNVLGSIESIGFMASLVLYFAASVLYFIYAGTKKQKAAGAGFLLVVAGFVVHTLCIVVRGINAGRLPLTNQYEFASAFAWGIALCFLVFVKKYKFDALGMVVAPLIFLVAGYAFMLNREINSLMPALQSGWLGFHVCTAIVAYGGFGVAFGIALLYLLKGKLNGPLSERIPDERTLDTLIYRAVALGFLFLTLCMITGAIWAKRAWGSYWNWDPKETWSLITWIIYAIFLHLRLRGAVSGKKAALLAVIGFICVIFTYVGVNLLLHGLHSYA
ncbi:MAG: c-type cytochrome biogenesis protein CcsB [Firmicutes bacterium]|nr:c-type cytochrome biogenesis protein CcsB [Bacillota bacterium]